MAKTKKTNVRAASRSKRKKATPAKTVSQRPQVVAESDAARIIAAIKKIPRGRVCPYGVVAEVAGLPRRARLVGTVLRQTPTSKAVPWFRVINASGRISFPQGSDSYARQRKHLEAEGVDFVGRRVDLNRYGWPPREKLLDELVWGPK
jgi:methylated-DNA-protein-cysteine methyltransferase-like protein